MDRSPSTSAGPSDSAAPLSLSPDFVQQGLSQAEAAQRTAQGLLNHTPVRSSRALSAIFRENFLSITNVILFGIMIALVGVGKPGDALITGGVVLLNVAVGVFQEIRAKRQLDRIALLSRPKVTALRDGAPHPIDPGQVVLGDALVLAPGDQVVVDGRLISDKPIDVDESLLTGESDHVAKAHGDELLSGSFCVAGNGVYLAERIGSDAYAVKLTTNAREYRRVLTPLQRQVSILVRLLVILAISLAILIFLSAAISDTPFAQMVQDTAVVIALVPQGLLLMITVAYALGAVRMARQGALVQQINAVESLSNVDVLCLDKTGTLTTNRIRLHEMIPLASLSEDDFRNIVGDFVASTGSANRTAEAIRESCPGTAHKASVEIPFSSEHKWSGATFEPGSGYLSGSYVLGAPEILMPFIDQGHDLENQVSTWTDLGLRVLLFAHHLDPLNLADGSPNLPHHLVPLGWLTFTDELRPDAKQVLDQFRRAGVTLKLISGDNPQTVAALAQMAGISDDVDVISGLDLDSMTESQFVETVERVTVFGRITPEQKQRIVQALRAGEHYVAMVGDGVNDVLSLKQAHMGIAMESGSQATRAVADMVLLGDQFAVLPEAINEGQRILNGMQDNMRLFLSRTLYAALLIIVAGFVGTEFPFTPKHNAILTTLPVGIPALFLTLWARPGHRQKNLLRSVSEFVLPAGFSIMIVTLVVWLLYHNQSLLLQRTLLTTTALLCGLVVIIFAEHDIDGGKTGRLLPDDRRRVGLAFTMLLVYAALFPIPSVRDALELSTLAWQDLGIIVFAVVLWAVSLQVLWRYDLFRRMVTPVDQESG